MREAYETWAAVARDIKEKEAAREEGIEGGTFVPSERRGSPPCGAARIPCR